MRSLPRFLALTVVLPALLLSGTPSSAVISPQAQRLYLLSADTDYLYWSADRFDPELGVGTIRRACGAAGGSWGIPGQSKPCLVGSGPDGTSSYNVFSLPASLLGENVTWNATTPLRFHIEGAVNTFGAPYTVHFLLQKGTELVASLPATQVSPGVWEGEIKSGSPLRMDQVNFLTVRVETPALGAVIDLKLGGRTYLELPRPYPAHGVPDLMRGDSYSPEPTGLALGTRTFTFNDESWAARSFSGTTGPVREFSFDTSERAEILLAWVEVFDSTFGQGLRRGEIDPKKLNGVGIRLLRGGEEIAKSRYPNGAGGVATAALSALDLPPGPVTLAVGSAIQGENEALPFAVHVLEVRGERTLAATRWPFTHIEDSGRTPVSGTCPPPMEVVPTTDEVRSIALDLDWESAAVGLPDYSIRFTVPDVGEFPCSEAGTGDRVRLTVPPQDRIWWVGATPAYDAAYYSAYDTTFEMSARYTYSSPPAT